MASDVERIKEKLPIEEVLAAYVTLEKSGGRLRGRCPFHSEKTPSFFVSPERGSYYCFGCGVKGDIFTFVQEFEKLDFVGALKVLAERAGIELTREAPAARDETAQLYELLERVTLFYQKQLAEHKEVIKYLTDRGLTIATIKAWRIGFAPDDWRATSTALIAKGYAPKLLEKAGLTKPSEKNPAEHYDRFRSRIMFPLQDSSGRVVGFSGRIFGKDDEAAKYLNSPETPLFDKSSFLYGFDKAKFAIRKEDTAILVEGQMDIIMSHQAGITNTVAVSGTALTDKHIDILRRFAHNLVLAFDADSAGQRASEKAATLALSKGMEVKAIEIHGGKDPADLVLENPELWRTAIKNSVHIIEYQLGRAMTEPDARKRGRLVEELVLPHIAALPSPLERAHFIGKVALAAGLTEKALEESLKQIPIVEGTPSEINPEQSGIKESKGSIKRIDMVERRVAALLVWLEQEQNKRPDVTVEYVKDYITNTVDKELYAFISTIINEHRNELAFEGEASFSGAASLRKEVDAMLSALREEHLKRRLADAMVKLKVAERKKEQADIDKILKECQEISQELHKLKNNL